EEIHKDQSGAWPDSACELYVDRGGLERVLPADWQRYEKVAEDTDYVIGIKPETDCDVYNETATANPLCATFTLQTGDYPYGSLLSESVQYSG
ncbi:hypothetical protein PPTG_22972, partial [Phytophthora nicotianae INRA-310]